ncbi:PolC-type DNA polymerase III [Aeromonas sp. R4-3]|uniref:3'-5' exonuclease n=1 Tax=Aeromonas TaxID=642 RepID=UPI0034A39E5D
MSTALANTVVVLDFETTGLSPGQGDRAIEIGAVRIENGHISERFSALMNPGFNVSSFIEQYTGISNAMLKQAPPCGEVMADFVEFIGDDNLVAHNASFDKRFLDAEIEDCRRTILGSSPAPCCCRDGYSPRRRTINWLPWCNTRIYPMTGYFTAPWPMLK